MPNDPQNKMWHSFLGFHVCSILHFLVRGLPPEKRGLLKTCFLSAPGLATFWLPMSQARQVMILPRHQASDAPCRLGLGSVGYERKVSCSLCLASLACLAL